MARRRKRYSVTISDPVTKELTTYHVLANPTPDVIDCIRLSYIARGYDVCDVHPVRRRQRPIPSTPTSPSWAVDQKNLDAAIVSLGIKWPVRIKKTGRRGGRYGAHTLRYGWDVPRGMSLPAATVFYHHITIKSWLKPRVAGETVWHELAHAMQSERAIQALLKKNPRATLAQQREAWDNGPEHAKGTAYWTRPCEVEARTYEPMNKKIPLTKREPK